MLILIADDHDMVRDGLQLSLNFLQPTPHFLTARNAEEVLNTIDLEPKLDLILLDLVMPGSDGLNLLTRVRKLNIQTPIVIVSAMDNQDTIRKAITLGANGFVPKKTPREIMRLAIEIVLAGGTYAPQSILREREALTGQTLPQETTSVDATNARTEPLPLTKRQLQVLDLLCKGKKNKQIASELHLSEHTVKVHVASILNNLGADNRTQAVIRAREQIKTNP